MLEFEQQRAKYNFWPGVRGRTPRLNIHTAHKNIIRFAKNNNIGKVCIAEDDLKFTAPGAWKYYLSNMPDEFDIYFGTISSGTISTEKIITGDFTGLILYTVAAPFYDRFLDAPETKQLDYSIASINGLYKVCVPMIATCFPGYSDARGKVVDDSKHFKGRKLYSP